MNKLIFDAKFLKILFSITLLVQVGIMTLEGNFIIPFVSALLTVFWFWILYKRSTLRKTIYFRVILGFFAVLMVGLLFKIEHLSGASVLINLSVLGVVITYWLRTFKKKKKALLDWLKLSWLIAVSLIYLGILEHFIPREYGMISNMLFLLMIGVFCLKAEQDPLSGIRSVENPINK